MSIIAKGKASKATKHFNKTQFSIALPSAAPLHSQMNLWTFVGEEMGVDTERARTSTQAVRDAQNTHLGHAQLAAGGREQRADHGVRGILEIRPKGEVRRRTNGKEGIKLIENQPSSHDKEFFASSNTLEMFRTFSPFATTCSGSDYRW